MSILTPVQAEHAAAFRRWIADHLDGDARFHDPQTDDRPDGSTLTTRWSLGRKLFLEVTVRPLIPQLRIGIVTDDRWRSEELEDAVESSGDSMSEFLEVAFAEAGLDWAEPSVEHYRDQGKWFSFVTPLELASIAELDDPAVRKKALQMIEGYCASYGKA